MTILARTRLPILLKIAVIVYGLLALDACKTSEMSQTRSSDLSRSSALTFDKNFFFGIATAPAHAEDQLNDIWLDFARSEITPGIRAWSNAGYPELRLKFFSQYQVEIDLAKQLGSQVFRLGVDWGRLVPEKPKDGCPQESLPCFAVQLDATALQRYQEIIRYVRSQGMTPMVTLYHHSLPKWLQDAKLDRRNNKNNGGWTNPDSVFYFEAFVDQLVPYLKADVDQWIVFNEPAIFASLAYSAGIWPPAQGVRVFSVLDLGFFKGDFVKAMDHMVVAHNRVYKLIKKKDTAASGDRFTQGPASVGIAHNVGYYTADDPAGAVLAKLMQRNINFKFIDGTIESLDFLGINYYGEENVKPTAGLAPKKDKEYSESGRGVNPLGLFESLQTFHKRYLNGKRKIPIYITENGISDATDILRPAYLTEHLAAIAAARQAGIAVQGYIFWTLSDNWEWADGYCPKFGLVEVDRSTPELRRLKRSSFDLYAKIIQQNGVSQEQREEAWKLVRNHVGDMRPFCRSEDGAGSLDVPVQRPIVDQDWRFVQPALDSKDQDSNPSGLDETNDS